MFRRFLIFLGKFGIFVLAFLFGAFLIHTNFNKFFLQSAAPGNTNKEYFIVEPDQNFKTTGEKLEARGLLKKWFSIYAIARFKGDEGSAKLMPGEYEISAGMTPIEIFKLLTSGKVVQHKITIPEGFNIRDIAELMAKSGLVTLEEAKDALNNRNLMGKLRVPSTNPEGLLFPETYLFTRPISAEAMIERMVQENEKKLEQAISKWKLRAGELGLTPYQVITLASIVEKETADAKERATIASVFHNRLKIGMPLQSDPTVIYGVANFDGNLTKEHLKTPGPYNTYINTGLPPGPIANPGVESVRAVLYPEDTDYLYFVAKGNGSHKFSATYKEHLDAVKQYQLGGKSEKEPVTESSAEKSSVTKPNSDSKTKASEEEPRLR